MNKQSWFERHSSSRGDRAIKEWFKNRRSFSFIGGMLCFIGGFLLVVATDFFHFERNTELYLIVGGGALVALGVGLAVAGVESQWKKLGVIMAWLAVSMLCAPSVRAETAAIQQTDQSEWILQTIGVCILAAGLGYGIYKVYCWTHPAPTYCVSTVSLTHTGAGRRR